MGEEKSISMDTHLLEDQDTLWLILSDCDAIGMSTFFILEGIVTDGDDLYSIIQHRSSAWQGGAGR